MVIPPIRQRKKNPVLQAKRFQKAVGRSTQFFKNILLPKLSRKKLKNHDFFLLVSLAIFHSNFGPKTADFTIFFQLKKKSANGEKHSIAPVEQVFFFFLA